MESLGLDLKLLIAQIVNFGILFIVLKKVLYKPILKILDDRSKKISESLENSKKAEEALAKIAEKEVKILKIAKEKANQEKEEIIHFAQEEKQKIIDEAKLTAQREVKRGLEVIRANEVKSRVRLREEFLNEAVERLIKKLAKSGSKSLLDQILK